MSISLILVIILKRNNNVALTAKITIFLLALAVSQDVAASAQSGGDSARPAVATERLSEEVVLARALKQLKANNLDQAIRYLESLKEAFPDNDDYLLLYRTALRKRNSSDPDSQKWYNYQRALDRKEESRSDANTAGSAAGDGASGESVSGSSGSASGMGLRTSAWGKNNAHGSLTGTSGGVMKVPASSRVNELKVATWVQLTTGKHKSPNAGRLIHSQDK